MHANDPELLGSPEPDTDRARVLFVCTANQCRSPFAEAIARRAAAGLPLDVASAGFLRGGATMPDAGKVVARELGFDFEAHRSRQLDLHDLRGYDVVLTMTRAHSRDLLVTDGELWPRVFTVKQFARWLGDHTRPRRAQLGPWLDVAARQRHRSEAVGASPDDDLPDPVKSPPSAWRKMAHELDLRTHDIIGGLYPPSRIPAMPRSAEGTPRDGRE